MGSRRDPANQGSYVVHTVRVPDGEDFINGIGYFLLVLCALVLFVGAIALIYLMIYGMMHCC